MNSELTAFARKENISYQRAQQIETQALAKVTALVMAQSFDYLERTDLKLLVKLCRNARAKAPRSPGEIVREFREREEREARRLRLKKAQVHKESRI